MARIQAAENALRNFIQFKDATAITPIKTPTNVDFTSDDHIENDGSKTALSKKQTPDKGPVMLLYELFSDVQIDCVSTDGVQHSRFKMVATVNGQKFDGTGKFDATELLSSNETNDHFSFYLLGPSKKLAKNAAAKAALATLRDISFSPMQMKSMETAPVENNKKQSHELPQTFADSIGKYVVILIEFEAN